MRTHRLEVQAAEQAKQQPGQTDVLRGKAARLLFMASAELAARFPSHRFVFYDLTVEDAGVVDLSDEQIDSLIGVCARVEGRLQRRSERDVEERDRCCFCFHLHERLSQHQVAIWKYRYVAAPCGRSVSRLHKDGGCVPLQGLRF